MSRGKTAPQIAQGCLERKCHQKQDRVSLQLTCLAGAEAVAEDCMLAGPAVDPGEGRPL